MADAGDTRRVSPCTSPSKVAFSAPGKVLLAGGYLILNSCYKGLVFSLDTRINVAVMPLKGKGEVVVESPQFAGALWRYHCLTGEGGAAVTLRPMAQQTADRTAAHSNIFIETTVTFVLTYIAQLLQWEQNTALAALRIVILADNGFYCQPDSITSSAHAASDTPETRGTPASDWTTSVLSKRFTKYSTELTKTNKTGLGSSAALVTAITVALMAAYGVPPMLDTNSAIFKTRLWNLAQVSHCVSQRLVGSGFDIAAAVYGPIVYSRFSIDKFDRLLASARPGFAVELVSLIDDTQWDVFIDPHSAVLPPGVALLMCDVQAGSSTVGMVKEVQAWIKADERALTLMDELDKCNLELGAALRDSDSSSLERRLPVAISAIRVLLREMGQRANVPIEPPTQTRLLDALSALEGVYGGVVPGAGGYDALALLVRDDGGHTVSRVAEWLRGEGSEFKAQLMGVRAQTEGFRQESFEMFTEWL